METRKATHGSLQRWNAHKKYLVETSIKYIDVPEIRNAFTNWVINGDNAPQFGDELFDYLYAKENGLYINRYFIFKTYTNQMYKDCILRKQMGSYGSMMNIGDVSFDPYTMRLEVCGEYIYL